MATVRFHHHRLALQVDGAAWDADTGRRLDRQVGDNVLPCGNAAQDAAGVVGEEPLRRHLVAMLAALLRHTTEARPYFHTFCGIDAHQGVGDFRIQPVIHRLAPAHRHVFCHHRQLRAYGVAGFAQRIHVIFQRRHQTGIGRKERIVIYPNPALERHVDVTQLRNKTAYHHAVAFRQPLLGNCTGRHTHRCFTCRGATATAMVAKTVFLRVGVIGVPRTERLADIAVILTALIFVADQQCNWRACGLALEHA